MFDFNIYWSTSCKTIADFETLKKSRCRLNNVLTSHFHLINKTKELNVVKKRKKRIRYLGISLTKKKIFWISSISLVLIKFAKNGVHNCWTGGDDFATLASHAVDLDKNVSDDYMCFHMREFEAMDSLYQISKQHSLEYKMKDLNMKFCVKSPCVQQQWFTQLQNSQEYHKNRFGNYWNRLTFFLQNAFSLS